MKLNDLLKHFSFRIIQRGGMWYAKGTIGIKQYQLTITLDNKNNPFIKVRIIIDAKHYNYVYHGPDSVKKVGALLISESKKV